MTGAAAGSADAAARLRARVELWTPALHTLLDALYGEVIDTDALVQLVIDIASEAAGVRRVELQQLDIRREADPAWFQRPSMVGYVAYADRFAGTLQGVVGRLDYLAELRIGYLHLMKVLRARDGANDGGYAVADYHEVDPSLGTWADLEHLTDELHGRGISLCVDVVMNHTAREHEWARLARTGSARHRDYYLVFPDRTEPDRFEATLPEVFPDLAPGNFTWDDDLRGWVWTTFNDYQWDLNYANPEVLVEMLRIMLALANSGVDVLRLDAVAFTWKRLGTNCQNQPEAHVIAQVFRALLAIAAPGTLLKAEAIVAPSDLLPYLGVHRLQRPECHLAYHNQLMVMLWSGLASGDAILAGTALAALPPTPAAAGWVNYVRCHDDIGWAVSDADATAVGASGPAHRAFLARFYRGDFYGSFADGVPFSTNPQNGDERTCGSTAALCGVGRALRAGDPVALDLAVRRVQLLYAVMFGFPGIPLVYMGDELALDNDLAYVDDPARVDDSRWIHRPEMPWTLARERTTAGSVEQRVFSFVQHLADVRGSQPAMCAGGDLTIHRHPDTAVLAWARRHPTEGRFFGVANFAARPATVPIEAPGWAGLQRPRLVLGDALLGDALLNDALLNDTMLNDTMPNASGSWQLEPYGVAWFVDDADGPLQPAC